MNIAVPNQKESSTALKLFLITLVLWAAPSSASPCRSDIEKAQQATIAFEDHLESNQRQLTCAIEQQSLILHADMLEASSAAYSCLCEQESMCDTSNYDIIKEAYDARQKLYSRKCSQ